MNAAQFAPGNVEVAGIGRARADAPSVIAFGQRVEGDGVACAELYALGLHHAHAAVDDCLLQLKVGNAEAQQTAHVFVFLKHGDGIALAVQAVGGGKAGRP